MSVVIHRCKTCQHPDYYHNLGSRECSYNWCGQARHTFAPGPSEVIPTFDKRGQVQPVMHAPGTVMHQWGYGARPLCDCDSCVLLAERTAAV